MHVCRLVCRHAAGVAAGSVLGGCQSVCVSSAYHKSQAIIVAVFLRTADGKSFAVSRAQYDAIDIS